MSRSLKLTIGISLSLLVILVAVVLFLRHLLTKSFPVTEGSIAVAGLLSETQVYRDRLGVPHVLARNEYDMFFTQGYVHAQDRLWQMDMIRRIAQGRVSEILGEMTVDFDKLFRTLGIARISEEIEQGLPPETRQLLAAYADGVNAFLRGNEHRLPIEFDLLDYRPDSWEPRHSIMVGRMIAWDLAMGTMTDIPFAMLADKVSLEKAAQAIPVTNGAVSNILTALRELQSTLAGHLTDDTLGIAGGVQWGEWFMPVNYKFRTASGSGRTSAGSNSWAVGPKHSVSGRPILANDLHLVMPVPSLWYQMHLSSPGWNVAGVSLPGAPLIVVGKNDAVAWGFTNGMIDDVDFFIEEVDVSLSTYLFRGRWLPLKTQEETMYIGKNDSLVLTRRSTHHGPIVDEILKSVGQSSPDSAPQHRFMLSMQWTGFESSDEFRAFYLMNKATNAAEFEAGVRSLAVPGQNVVYADTLGNIAHWVAARIPVRRNYNPMFPLPGWTGDADWKGYIPFNQLPKVWNPPEGFIASANNPFVGINYSYYVSDLWEPPSRITRIREMLNSPDVLSVEDVKRFQTDILSPHGREFSTHILRAFQDEYESDPLISSMLEYLRNWDFQYHRDNVAPTIVNTTFLKFLRNVFEDEMGDTLFRYFVTFTAIPYRAADQLLSAGDSTWFDDARTSHVETKDEILRKSLYDAMEELQTFFGNDTKLWRWGSLHTVTFVHPFGTRKPLDNVFNIGPFPLGGSGSTVNKAEFRFTQPAVGSTDPYAVVVGASMRHVIDLGDRTSFFSIITSGVSGQALHKHYDDQTILWLNGGYHTMIVNWKGVPDVTWERLTLKPK